MRMSGVCDTAMWLSWWTFFLFFSMLTPVVWLISGIAFGTDGIAKTDAGVVWVSLFFFYLSLAAWACFFSTIVRSNIVGCACRRHVIPTTRPMLLLIARLVIGLIMVFAKDFRPSGFLVVIFEFVMSATDPPLKAIRRVIPPLRIGQVSLDLAFLVLFIGLQLILRVLGGLG